MKLFILFISLILLVGCGKQDLITYEEGDGIYFTTENMYLDTIDIAWGLKKSDLQSQKIKLEVILFGNVADHDRPFKVIIGHDKTDALEGMEGVDYKPLQKQYSVPAGKASTIIEVELLRNPILTKESRRFTIKLEKSNELDFLYSRKRIDSNGVIRYLDYQRVIRMTEDFPRPNWWSYYGTDYFGAWTVKKSILICDVMNINRELWMTTPNFSEDFTEGFIKYAGVYMHRWLQEQNPKILETDGKPMEMGRKSKR